ncbi:aldo/keto reductase [Auritidibacter ignavus]|uniref:aldo/keto reductase n=1 Tax=Auritidibacter ignavus TaxID=678932 RepID=UPI0024BB9FD7|nr:aldo/keto reductase [Auritidibacter ignavus]WHS35905.1 aldo/keto reductase [Auritidibacter ignavus]
MVDNDPTPPDHAPQHTTIPWHRLSDGGSIPGIGFGTLVQSRQYQAATEQAIAHGYRLIDTALRYDNERDVGAAVRASGVARQNLVITTKIPGRCHGYDTARQSIETSLERLGLDHIDIALIHWPLPRLDRYVETWHSMIEMRSQGLITTIGVSNFLPEHLLRLHAESGVMPEINQIEMHPYFPQADQRAFHAEHHIVTESWSPLGRGTAIMQEPVIAQIAGAHEVKPAQVILRWHIQHDAIPLPASSSPEHQRDNLALDFTLAPEEMDQIDGLARGRISGQDPRTHEEF